MQFNKIIIRAPEHAADALSDLLITLGAISVSLEAHDTTEILEPPVNTTPLWPEVNVSALFDEGVSPAFVQQSLLLTPFAKFPITLTVLSERDWQANLKQDFQPQAIAPNLWICPTWATPPTTDAAVVKLDPGLAFGTGKHPTTALCLRFLAQCAWHGQSVIDYGTGSGILAIAAKKLGAKIVFAIDHDEQALQATAANAQQNQVDDEDFHIFAASDFHAEPVDIVVANILAMPLITLAPQLTKLVKVGGKIALSGILIDQVDMVTSAYQAAFAQLTVVTEEDWALIEGIRI